MRAGIPVLTMSELISTVRENLVRSYKILDESEQHRVRILTWSMVGQGKVREWWGIGVMETGGNAEGKRRLTFPPSLRVEKSSGSKGGSEQKNEAHDRKVIPVSHHPPLDVFGRWYGGKLGAETGGNQFTHLTLQHPGGVASKWRTRWGGIAE